MTKKTLLLGAHISIAGGFEQAIIRGESIGCTAIQIFTKSNRQWNAKPIPQETSTLFKEAVRASSIQTVIAHAAYLINIGSPHNETRNKSIQSLMQELHRCQQLTIPYLVLHPGSRGSSSSKECLTAIAQALNQVLDTVPGTTMILLETMAGQGSNVCYHFEQLASVYELCHHKDRIGICFDTCHAFAAGYDLTTQSSYQETWKRFDHILGLDLLKAIHINDSKKGCGARVDRHEHIGKGMIGNECFQLLFNDTRFFTIPKILETPKDSLADDLRNIQHIESLITLKTKDFFRIAIPEMISEAKSK